MTKDRPGAMPVKRSAGRKIDQIERHFIWLKPDDIAYCRVPKAANSAIRFLLADAFGVRPSAPDGLEMRPNNDRFWLHVPPKTARSLTRKQYVQGFPHARGWSFSFVRHPVSRLYSCWNNKVMENSPLSRRFQKMGVVHGMSFADFVARVAQSDDAHCDIHVRAQFAILALGGRILPDFIGRVEQIGPDWAHVQMEVRARTGRALPDLVPRNVRAKASPDIAQTIDPHTLGLIRERYRDDFKHFYPE
ncbi:MAG: sulfotransferase family 2 domain-containing protein [Paracoccaceae bacterium]